MANPEHSSGVAQLWEADSVHEKPGKSAVEIFTAVKSSEIKTIWIAFINPAQSMLPQALIYEALQTAECV
jgi:hypothetical protein